MNHVEVGLITKDVSIVLYCCFQRAKRCNIYERDKGRLSLPQCAHTRSYALLIVVRPYTCFLFGRLLKYFLFGRLVSSASVYYTECKPKNKKWGRPRNKATKACLE